MVTKNKECKICGSPIRANGVWSMNGKMSEHMKKHHLKEFRESGESYKKFRAELKLLEDKYADRNISVYFFDR